MNTWQPKSVELPNLKEFSEDMVVSSTWKVTAGGAKLCIIEVVIAQMKGKGKLILQTTVGNSNLDEDWTTSAAHPILRAGRHYIRCQAKGVEDVLLSSARIKCEISGTCDIKSIKVLQEE